MVKPAIHQEAECLADWYKMAQTIFLQTQILEKDLVSYEDSIYELKDRLNRIKEELKSENVDPKKNVSSMFKESSMAVRKRLEISSNVKVSRRDLTSFNNSDFIINSTEHARVSKRYQHHPPRERRFDQDAAKRWLRRERLNRE